MEEKESLLERYYPHIITIGLLLIIISGGFAYYEFHGAKRFCNSVNGIYTIKLFPLPIEHYCDNKTIAEYNSGWNFQKPNLSRVNISIPLW